MFPEHWPFSQNNKHSKVFEKQYTNYKYIKHFPTSLVQIARYDI